MSDNSQSSGRTVLVLADHPPLNRAHAEFLRLHGYKPLTAITYTDVFRLMEERSPDQAIFAIVVSSKVHGWHHREGESQPQELDADSDRWQLDNIREVYELVAEQQEEPPKVLIAESLIETGWYQITEQKLSEMDFDYEIYNATHLNTLSEVLQGLE